MVMKMLVTEIVVVATISCLSQIYRFFHVFDSIQITTAWKENFSLPCYVFLRKGSFSHYTSSCKYTNISSEFQCHKLQAFPFQTPLVAWPVLGTQSDQEVLGDLGSKASGTEWIISVNWGFSLANGSKLAFGSQVADKKEIEIKTETGKPNVFC